MKEINMTSQKKDNAQEKPANQSTQGNPNDPRLKSADLIEKDNEEKLGEKNLDSKTDKAGG
jgi:hypothetical protein